MSFVPPSSASPPITRAHCEALDAADPLAFARERFDLPEGIIYLDGNSLGAMPCAVSQRLRQAELEWSQGLIRSWNDAGWYHAPQRVAAQIAPLIGAQADEVIVADSTSVNLFKLLSAGIGLARRSDPGRRILITEQGNFPTDGYLCASVAAHYQMELVRVPANELPQAIQAAGQQLALVQLTHVDYRSGRMLDMPAITALAHAQGALCLWDLAHTAGAMPVQLNAWGVDLAVGCGYKYLNGGPGAPAFAFVAKRLISWLEQPLIGWHGHAEPFAFEDDWRAAPGIERLLCGTAPQLSLLAMEAALSVFKDINLNQVRAKSVALGETFIALAEQALGGFETEASSGSQGFCMASPREAHLRGSQVALSHPHGHAMVQALIARGVIGDFRAPDLLRFGFAPLYLRHVDVFDAVEALSEVVRSGEWLQPAFAARRAVT